MVGLRATRGMKRVHPNKMHNGFLPFSCICMCERRVLTYLLTLAWPDLPHNYDKANFIRSIYLTGWLREFLGVDKVSMGKHWIRPFQNQMGQGTKCVQKDMFSWCSHFTVLMYTFYPFLSCYAVGGLHGVQLALSYLWFSMWRTLLWACARSYLSMYIVF